MHRASEKTASTDKHDKTKSKGYISLKEKKSAKLQQPSFRNCVINSPMKNHAEQMINQFQRMEQVKANIQNIVGVVEM